MSINISIRFTDLLKQDRLREEDVAIVLQNSEDRTAFLQWAARSMPIIHQSSRLIDLHQRILLIESSYGSYTGSKVRQTAMNYLGYIQSSVFKQPQPEDLDAFAATLRAAARRGYSGLTLSENNLQHCADCINSGLLAVEQVRSQMSGSNVDLEETRLAALCKQYPEFSVDLLIAFVKGQGISTQTLEDLLPFIQTLPPDVRVKLFLVKNQKTKEPLFVQLTQVSVEWKSMAAREIIGELVQQGLCLDSEDYLRIPPQSYQLRIQTLLELVRSSFLPREVRNELSDLIKDNGLQEERLLLQYLTPEEKEVVRLAEKDLQEINQIASLVGEGKWEVLFHSYPTNSRDLSYLLIAAYRLRRIDLEDLATAMSFHRVYCNTERGRRCILPITQETLGEMINMNQGDKQKMLSAANQAKPNQRYLIMVDQDAINPYTWGLIVLTFMDKSRDKIPGFFQSQTRIGMAAFGTAQQLHRNLAPVIHLAPTAMAMAGHVRSGRSDFVLLFPEEEAIVHGSQDKTIFAPIHDLLHTFGRNKRGCFQEAMMDRIEFIQKAPELQVNYQRKMTDGKGNNYPRFRETPTSDEMTAFLLDRVIGEIIDGGFSLSTGEMFDAEERALLELIESVVKAEFGSMPCHVRPEFRAGVVERVYERCGISPESSGQCSLM